LLLLLLFGSGVLCENRKTLLLTIN